MPQNSSSLADLDEGVIGNAPAIHVVTETTQNLSCAGYLLLMSPRIPDFTEFLLQRSVHNLDGGIKEGLGMWVCRARGARHVRRPIDKL